MRTNKVSVTKSDTEQLYIGIDVHKKSWNVHIMSEHISLGRMHMKPPSLDTLLEYLSDRYPHASYRFAYEAGFSGFGLQRSLALHGYDCIVVHPADIPTTDKDRATKSDAVDSRKIAESLRAQALHSIWIPTEQEEGDRELVRYRTILVGTLRTVKTRIKQRLMFHGVVIPTEMDNGSWTKRLRTWLGTVHLADPSAHTAWQALLADYDAGTMRVQVHSQCIRELAHAPRNIERVRALMSVRGIGMTTAMVLLTEIGPIDRFRSADALASFVGLIPCERSSSERTKAMGIQRRRHAALRSNLVEAAWIAIRHDTHLREVYNRHVRSKPAQKAIVVVARKLLNRIHHELCKERHTRRSSSTDC